MNIIYALQVLLGFGFVIAIHEAGHFLAAKRVGVTCPAFSVGFPMPVWTPKGWKYFNIFRFTWRGTEYRLGWIPFGGYVTMHGQSDSPGQLDKPKEGDQSDYRNKSYWQKTQVLLGGVFMNAVTAVIGFIIAFQVGVTFIEPTVGRVDPTSQAWVDNEIRVGDRVLQVNGREVVDFEDVVYAGIFDGGDTVDVVVERDGPDGPEQHSMVLSLDPHPVFGIKMPAISAKHRVIITGEEAGLFDEALGENRPRDGDELVAVDGRPIRNVDDAIGFLEVSRGPIALTFRRGFTDDAREWTITHSPRRVFYHDASAYIAGVSLLPAPYVDLVRRGGPAEQAGILPGDRFVGFLRGDGEEIKLNSFGDMARVIDESRGNPVTFVILRGEERKEITAAPEERENRPGRYQLGMTVSPFQPVGLSPAERGEKRQQSVQRVIAHGVRPGSGAEQAGLRPGDEIVDLKINGEPLPAEILRFGEGSFNSLVFQGGMNHAARMGDDVELTLVVKRDMDTRDIVVPAMSDGPDSGAFMALATAEMRSDPVTYGLFESVNQGFYHSKKVGYKIMMTLSALFTGRVKIWHLGGPVVIAKRSYTLAQWGVGTLIFFLAFISINLAIINLLPIPVLDGGQWLIVTIESALGKPLPPRIMNLVGLASFVFVLGLMLFILANDLLTVFVRKWV